MRETEKLAHPNEPAFFVLSGESLALSWTAPLRNEILVVCWVNQPERFSVRFLKHSQEKPDANAFRLIKSGAVQLEREPNISHSLRVAAPSTKQQKK